MSAPNKSYDPVEVADLSPEAIETAVALALEAIAAASDLDSLKEARLAHSGVDGCSIAAQVVGHEWEVRGGGGMT